MNSQGIVHVDKEELALMCYSRHRDRTTLAIKVLMQMNLLQIESNFNPRTQRHYYKYFARQVEFEEDEISDFAEFSYVIPEYTLSIIGRWLTPNVSNKELKISPILQQPYANPSIRKSEVDFCSQFTGWYDELMFQGCPAASGHFSPSDGRYYHKLHSYDKEMRYRDITWDGEVLVEVWDAHSSFFIVMGYYLTHRYKGDIDYGDEAIRLLELATSNKLYATIQAYHNERAEIKFSREEIKKYVQIYKNYQRKTLFRKDGAIKNCWWCERYRYIDEFFRVNFPKVRDLLLDYPRRLEIDEDKWGCIRTPTGDLTWGRLTKWVSEITHDIMPYEFELISLGICRDLWDIYGIKSVTVHDAIYMKASDARRKVDIDHLLRCRLGLAESSETERALF